MIDLTYNSSAVTKTCSFKTNAIFIITGKLYGGGGKSGFSPQQCL